MGDVVEYRAATHADARNVAALHAENWRLAYRGNFRDEYLDGDIVPERESVWDMRLSHPQVGVPGGIAASFGGHPYLLAHAVAADGGQAVAPGAT